MHVRIHCGTRVEVIVIICYDYCESEHMYAHCRACVEVRDNFRDSVSPFTFMWVLGMELRSQACVVSVFTH